MDALESESPVLGGGGVGGFLGPSSPPLPSGFAGRWFPRPSTSPPPAPPPPLSPPLPERGGVEERKGKGGWGRGEASFWSPTPGTAAIPRPNPPPFEGRGARSVIVRSVRIFLSVVLPSAARLAPGRPGTSKPELTRPLTQVPTNSFH